MKMKKCPIFVNKTLKFVGHVIYEKEQENS